MNQEKFNPHNPEYKKVEDLPQEHQAEFSDVEGGFVRRSAAENFEKAETRADEINAERRAKMSGWGGVLDRIFHEGETTLGVLHDDAQEEDKKIEGIKTQQRVIEELETGVAMEKFSVGSRDERIAYANELISYAGGYLFGKSKNAIETQIREGMRELGHEGFLTIENCCSWSDGCINLRGKIDGKSIDVHSKMWGTVDGRAASPEEGRMLIDVYFKVAVDLRDRYFGNGKNFEFGEFMNLVFEYTTSDFDLSNHHMATITFAKTIMQKYGDRLKKLKADNDLISENIRAIRSERDRLQREKSSEEFNKKLVEERAERAYEKAAREQEIQRNIGDVLPRK